MKRNILTVFLASPGDLEYERNITREVVDRINKVVNRRVNWHVELLGWEDTLPSYSRPQDIINKDVDCCDLFLGMLWKRWGQPTGEYTSGFHEEFIRAKERHTKAGIPEIWLFFKTIDNDNLEDPGEQLKKVLEFKKEQTSKKELFFKEFQDTDSWEKLIYDILLGYVLDLAKEEKETGPEKAIPISKEKEEDLIISGEKKQESSASFPLELGMILQKTINYINGHEDDELDFWEKTRLFLLANSWFSSEHLDERLGVHEVNLVYSQRKSWELSSKELMLVFRTSLIDIYNTRPGWYWFQDEEESLINDYLCVLSVTSKNKEVRKTAFNLMSKIGFRPPKKIIEKGLSDNESDVVLKVIDLLAQTGIPEDIELLDKLLENNETEFENSVAAARLDILYRENPNGAFREYMKVGGKTPIFIDDALKEMNLNVNEEVLIESLKSHHTDVKRFATNYLRNLKKLDSTIAKSLFEDPDIEVRRQALWALVELDEKITIGQVKKLFPPQKSTRPKAFAFLWDSSSYDYVSQNIRNEFYPSILKHTSPEEILASLDTYNSNNDIAYRYLSVNNFDLIENKIRSDLDNEFVDLVTELKQKEYWKSDTIEFVKGKMIQAALAGLVEHGNENDVNYARKFLGKTRYNMADPEAIKMLAKYGNNSDVNKLIEVAHTSSSETMREAFESALKLSNNRKEILEIMLKEGDGKSAGKAASLLWASNEERVRELSEAMLREENDDKRLIGLAIIVKFYNKEQLEALLDEYIEAPSYYYNVASWLDKILYAPGRYGEFFRKELQEKI